MNEVGFAVVGLGMGRGRSKLVTETDGARLVRVVDLVEERARGVGQELGCAWSTHLDDALGDDDVDVVFALTPSGTHGDLSIQTLEAGKHSITTKPMEISLEKCDAMIAAAQKAGKLLGVDFEQRYEDTPQKIKFALDRGLLGKPILGEGRLKWYRSQTYYDQSGGWRGTWEMDGGGALANQTIHNIDLLVWLMGRPKRVVGRTNCFTHDIETEDLGMAMIEFESGALGTILGTTTHPGDPTWAMELHGSEGGVLASLRGESKWLFLDGFEDRQDQLQRLCPQRNIVEDVVSALQHGTPLLCDGRQGRLSVELLTAIYKSARKGGEPVELN